ncbi:MAG: DMT family transporter [Gammaproteobacteria bacterium]|nr:DMT family transporter [Gammaproteobacteria bacterium]
MRISPYFLLTLTSLFWAGNFVVARAAHAEIEPIALAFWRWVIALTILLPFGGAIAWRERKLYHQNLWRITVLALTGIAAFNTLIYIGLQQTTATNALLLNSFIPVLTLILTWISLGVPYSLRQLFGVSLSICGVATIISRGDLTLFASLTLNRGDLLVMVAVVAWAIYTILLKGVPATIHRGGLMTTITFIGVVVLSPLYLSGDYAPALTRNNLLTLGYVGIFPSVLALLFYNRGVAEVGPERASMFIHLMPVFGTLLAITFLNEQIALFHLAGIGLIFGGLWLSLRRTSQPNPS